MNERAASFKLLQAMLRIRMIEQAIALEYPAKEMRCPVHLSIGQEAPAAAFSLIAQPEDLAVSTHRCHAHYLAKGGDLKSMIAEIYGKATGCSGGIGGSMHLIDTAMGFMGSSAIVGNSIPVGVGLGLAIKLKGLPQAACVFLGDGATEEGVFYESLNIAALLNLPVIFLCENNQYSVYTHLSQRQPVGRRIVDVARSLGVRAEAVDGHSGAECYDVLARELPAVRAGNGPILIEFATHRYLEHCGPNDDEDLDYRVPGELQSWLDRDPIETLANDLRLVEGELEALQFMIQEEIEDAFLFAKSSPFPNASQLARGIYA